MTGTAEQGPAGNDPDPTPPTGVRTSGVVITHGTDPWLADCLAAAAAQCDELLIVANLPPYTDPVPDGAVLHENLTPLGFAANANIGIARTDGEYVVLVNPDAVAKPGAVERLVAFADAHPRAGVIGPRLVYPDGGWQPSPRRFPTVWGTLVRRTPLRLLLDPARFSRSHYRLDEEPPTEPVEVDWMLGAFLLLRREMLETVGWFDEHFRLYGEDIDLAYRASRAGWQRWYVPDAEVQHTHNAVTDRSLFTKRTLWHWRGIARFVRKHSWRPELEP